MINFTNYLLELAQVTNGAVNGGPLGASIITPSEASVSNKKASKFKLLKFTDEVPVAQHNGEFESSEDVYDQYSDRDTEEVTDSNQDTYKLFQQFLDWQQSCEENEEPESIEEPESMEDPEPMEDPDPNRQGIIRVVKNAHLVYKREQPDGFYEELWIYNLTPSNNPVEIKQQILSDTDIPPNATESEDGSQSYSIWTCGNAQMLKITGIPN